MREIKFRGVSVRRNKWVYGHYHESINGHYIGQKSVIASEVIPESIGQYTGSKDIYGKEIYDGDTVELYSHNGITHKDELIDTVKITENRGSFGFFRTQINIFRCLANLARPGESLKVLGVQDAEGEK